MLSEPGSEGQRRKGTPFARAGNISPCPFLVKWCADEGSMCHCAMTLDIDMLLDTPCVSGRMWPFRPIAAANLFALLPQFAD